MCADWSASLAKRSAWAVDVNEGRAYPLPGRRVEAALADADSARRGRRALVAFDAPIGLPAAFLRAGGWGSFPEWLERADFGNLFAAITRASDWSVERPFIRPTRGEWIALLDRHNRNLLYRDVDVRSAAESVFKLVGAKQVGRAAQELWRELRAAREAGREFRIWPFETDLTAGEVVVAEIYPRLAYGAKVVKSSPVARLDVVRTLDPRFMVDGVIASEDDFDAAVTAITVASRLRDGLPLAGDHGDPVFEGSMLLAESAPTAASYRPQVRVPNRVGLITLACRDVERMARLFRDLGWPETPGSDEHHRTFQCANGCVIGLYAAAHYEPHFGPPADGFRAFALSINVGSMDEVRAIHEEMRGIGGVELLEEPAEASWGGGFAWRDPEGNLWDVAYAKAATFDDRGGVFFP